MKPPAPTLSDLELEVLKAFWRDGDLSGREAHDRVSGALGWSASTTRTVLSRMTAKGLLSRRDVHGLAVYRHVHPKVQVLSGLMRRLSAVLEMDRALPVTAFSGSQILDAADIAALEAMLDETGDEEDPA